MHYKYNMNRTRIYIYVLHTQNTQTMVTHYSQTQQQPIIVKYVQPNRNGIQSHNLTRHGIGYVLRGKKYIYYGDVRHEVKQGELFYLSIGHHYTEDIPEPGKSFEQIIFYYTPSQLSRILSHFNQTYKLSINNDHTCDNCKEHSHVIYPAWGTIKNFFSTTNQYIKEDLFSNDETAENIKMTELIYLILTQPDCCLKSKVLGNIDVVKKQFEQTIHNHIFDDISIEELANKCNRSLTSFKKEFRRHFYEPPHKWFIKQRLMHSRLLLISTNKSVSEIGIECNFPNASHFIKLFKKEYGLTPSTYRNCHKDNRVVSTEFAVPQVAVG